MNLDSYHRKPIRLRERLREATCEAILEAAEEAFAEEGPKARMESIAARAGIAVGTLYNHFRDRDALWAELRRSRREALLVRLHEALERVPRARFEAALRAFLHALVEHWHEHRGFLSVLVQVEPLDLRSPGPRSDGRTMHDEILSRLADLVRRGVAEGALRDEGAELHPTLLLGMLRAVLLRRLHGDASPATAEVDRMLDVFLKGAGRAR